MITSTMPASYPKFQRYFKFLGVEYSCSSWCKNVNIGSRKSIQRMTGFENFVSLEARSHIPCVDIYIPDQLRSVGVWRMPSMVKPNPEGFISMWSPERDTS